MPEERINMKNIGLDMELYDALHILENYVFVIKKKSNKNQQNRHSSHFAGPFMF